MKVIEKDMLWGELGLDSLLLDASGPSMDKEYVRGLPQGRKQAVIKHQQMIKKPTYNAIMGRYQAAPHKPKVITKSKLDRLADPVLGKFTHAESRRYEEFVRSVASPNGSPSPRRVAKPIHQPQRPEVHSDEKDHDTSYDDDGDAVFALTAAINASPVRFGHQSSHSSPSKVHAKVNSFFVTEGEERLESIAESQAKPSPSKIVTNIRSSRNGFASAFRDQIRRADKVGKLVQPMQLEDPSRAFALRARREQREQRQQKRAKDLPFQAKRGLRNGAGAAAGGPSVRGGKGRSVAREAPTDPLVGRLKKVKSSGYGALRGRVQPSVSNANAADKVKAKLKPLPKIAEGGSKNVSERALRSSRSTPMFQSKVPAPGGEARVRARLRKVQSDAAVMPSPSRDRPEAASLSPRRKGRASPRTTDANDGINDATTAALFRNADAGIYAKKRGVAQSVAALYQSAARPQKYTPPAVEGSLSAKAPAPEVAELKALPAKAAIPRQRSLAKPHAAEEEAAVVAAMGTLHLGSLNMLRPGQSEQETLVHAEAEDVAEPPTLAAEVASSSVHEASLDQYDLDTMMNKLKKFEKRVSSGGKVDNATLYTKGDVENTFAKHALRLGSSISNAESKLKMYADFKSGLE